MSRLVTTYLCLFRIVHCRRHVASHFLDCVTVNLPDTCAVVKGIEAGGLTMTEGL